MTSAMDKVAARKRLLEGKVRRLEVKTGQDSTQLWDLPTATIYEEQLLELWEEFKSLFDEIFSKCPMAEEANYQAEFNDLADRFDVMKVTCKTLRIRLQGEFEDSQNRARPHPNENFRHEISAKLPKLDPPRFSGNMLEWTTFRDLFTSMVHNHPTLAGAEKLKYLKTSLTGEAADLLASFSISDANYDEAWGTLQKRYHNTRRLIHAHLTRLMETPSIELESGPELRKLVDVTNSVVRALKALNRPIDEDCDLAMHIITGRLDSKTITLWETFIGREKIPKLSQLLEFLDDRAAILSSSESTQQSKQKFTSEGAACTTPVYPTVAHAHQVSASTTCTICGNGSHSIYGCDKFNNASIADRRAMVYQHNLCLNCLRPGHGVSKCFSESSCKRCGKRHHTLIHIDEFGVEAKPDNETASVHASIHDGDAKRALLPTALVQIRDEFNQFHSFRALIDPGADVSFVSARCVELLGLPKQKSGISFTGLGACAVGKSLGKVRMALYSRFEGDTKVTDVNAYVIQKVTGSLPKLPCSSTETTHLQHLPLADPTFDQPGTVDLLLGSDVYFHILRSGLFNINKPCPVAQETAFGWIVGGTCPSQNFASVASVNLIRCQPNQEENSAPNQNEPLSAVVRTNCKKINKKRNGHLLNADLQTMSGNLLKPCFNGGRNVE